MNTTQSLSDDERKHLDFIQSIVARLSSSSMTTKGWGLTVAIAAYSFAASEKTAEVAVLGSFAALLFGALDTRYLREERLFRCLYDDVRHGNVEPYAMTKDCYRDRCPSAAVFWSWSIAGFYLPLAFLGPASLVWTHLLK